MWGEKKEEGDPDVAQHFINRSDFFTKSNWRNSKLYKNKFRWEFMLLCQELSAYSYMILSLKINRKFKCVATNATFYGYIHDEQ